MDLKEKLAQGYIHARAIVEVIGKPKEHVEQALNTYLEKLGKAEDLEVLKKDIADAKQHQEYWATFAELEIIFKDMNILAQFCFEFMPSSIEIIAPEQMTVQNRQLTIILNNLQAKLHNVHAAAKHLQNENTVCKRNIQNILNNYISILLLKSEKTIKQLSKLTGLSEKNIEVVLNNLITQGKIKKQGDIYSLNKK